MIYYQVLLIGYQEVEKVKYYFEIELTDVPATTTTDAEKKALRGFKKSNKFPNVKITAAKVFGFCRWQRFI